ncbi:hypothetical protein F8388_023557 [Cannabis sativa]|uniref:Uncharacterized protein n=1 Tax=Cannabis sativa TaxID=3483 RepID=A0A7J6G042_CANSA|nr:hypothetical protein G4B88_000034 [Cannabis sativa]KAF4379540.1 hypothetical protein F8388_023557 [Cannabis sativa]
MQLFGLVCFRLNPNPDDNSAGYIELLNRRLLHWVNSSGKIYVSHTIVGGIYVLRFSVGMEPLLRKSDMSLPPGNQLKELLHRSNRACTHSSGALLHGGGTMVVASWLKGIGLQNSTRPPTTSIFAYSDRSSTVVHCRERTGERVG